MNGILLVDKPSGWTSFDVVAKIRGILRAAQKQELLRVSHLDAAQGSQEEGARRTTSTVSERQTPADTAMRQEPASMAGFARQQGKAMRKIRVGHAGTLDPLATGLLILLLGDYCKRAGEFNKLDKTYEVTMKLGQTSTSGDEEGEKSIVSSAKPSEKALLTITKRFQGAGLQTPHKFSAVKVNGQRAYKLAREGKEVVLEPRKVTIFEISGVKYAYPEVKFTCKVSSGTYIRSLVEDIGEELGTGAYMTALRRTKIGEFHIIDAHTPTEVNLSKTLTP